MSNKKTVGPGPIIPWGLLIHLPEFTYRTHVTLLVVEFKVLVALQKGNKTV